MSDTSKTRRQRQQKKVKRGKARREAEMRGLTPKFPIHLDSAAAKPVANQEK